MDICSSMGTTVSEDVNSFLELSPQCTSQVKGETVNDLRTGLIEYLNIQDDRKLVSGFISPNSNNGIKKEYIREEPQRNRVITLSDKCLTRSVTFPRRIMIASSAASIDGENERETEDDVIAEVLAEQGATPVNPHHSYSKSLPAPSKPVSAMKGSREKQGTPHKKLSVTWAPDVYDPLPTAVSHVVTTSKGSQRHHHHHHHRSSKKNTARSKQKGSSSKASRGSSNRGKDKKLHHRAYGGGGTSSRCWKSLDEDDDDDRVSDDIYEQVQAVDFDVGRPDPSYCGSSFLKKTVTTLHFSVAEAT
ncbi:hypothetical protein LguiA_016208 [Lonicera macranthoides]